MHGWLMGVSVFFSYARQDEALRNELAKHLKILERQGIIDTWSDRDIEAGTERATEIDERLNAADIILLLVSADFVASDYCYDVELKRAIERHDSGEARVIPIISRPLDWQHTPFGKLQVLPRNEQPITQWANQDEAFKDIAVGIRRGLEELFESQRQKQISLYRALLKWGYRQQARLFRRAIASESVAAFLIHGLPERGQRWLLNRLVVQYLPENLNSKDVVIGMTRLTRQTTVNAFWRELGGRVGLKKRRLTPTEVADGVYDWWRTQDVIMVFHHVEESPEDAIRGMVEEFWIPLTQRVQEAGEGDSSRKLLMFLVDYEGKAEDWELPFVEKLDTGWKPQTPIKTPEIQEFTENELMDWLDSEYRDLPSDLTHGIDDKVEEILDISEGGIPELVLIEICDQCGLDWYEEKDKWLRL